MKRRIDKQMEFLLEVDKLKMISRQTYLSNAKRKENDAEHSWHLAMMCLLLSEYANEEVDVLHVMSMVLIHDIIEIDAGDTYAYDEEANSTKVERELAAAERLFHLLPDDQAERMRGLWDEFEECKTPEAKFANTLDKVQPILLNDAAKGIAWTDHDVRLSQIMNRNKNTADGSKFLWDYNVYKYIMPNVERGNIYCDKQGLNLERFDLAYQRIHEIPMDSMKMPAKYQPYFIELAHMCDTYYGCIQWCRQNNYEHTTNILHWFKHVPVSELEKWNQRINQYRYCRDIYQKSYANPQVCVDQFGQVLGELLCYLAYSVATLGSMCIEQRYFEMTILAELLLQIYDIFETEEEAVYERSIKSAVYYYINDYMQDFMNIRVRDTIDSQASYFVDVLKHIDLSDSRSLYLYGDPISFNEIKSFEHMNSLTEDEINRLACAFVDGYIKSFELAGIDLTQKETVQIRYPIGFERMVICACNKFEEHGLCPVIARSSEHVIGLSLSQSGAIDTNPQAAYDHRYDKAIFFNRAIEEKLLQCMTHAYEEYKHEARVYAGPAVIEYFGEEKFNPINKPEAISFNNEQQKLQVEYSVSAGNLVNQFINRETFSFTIIALPVPSIGDKYTDIFKETLRINTLDIQKFDEIQTSLIDVLDLGEYVQIKGAGKNKTDLKISLQPIFNPERESGFHNCLADCNIPVGEVYTSPKLKGTEGLLHVSNVFINGLEYKDLQIHFRDGMTEQYSCNNYEDAKDSKQFIYDNLMRQHKTLPMGEFAIGTNTAAYSMGKRFQISEKLPILIAEKTGPHIAIGDTCFSMSEEIAVFNSDGKEVIARDNEISILRKQDVTKAYFSCHTDITIPYDELEFIKVITRAGQTIELIRDGRFVLESAMWLNSLFY